MYSIPVKIEGIERRKKSTGLLHVIGGLFLLLNTAGYYKLTGFQNFISVTPFFIASIISLGYGFFRKKLDTMARYNHLVRSMQFLCFFALGILLLNKATTTTVIAAFLWGVVTLFLMFTERKVFHDTSLHIKKEGIFVPGYFKSHVIPWHIIETFIARQDYITITRNNQHFVQLEVLARVESSELQKINSFCKEQIKEAQLMSNN